MKRYTLFAGAPMIIARAYAAAEKGELDGVSTDTIGKIAEMLSTLTPDEQRKALADLATQLGLTPDGKPAAKPSPDSNALASRTRSRAALAARHGEHDPETRRALARMSGTALADGKGDWTPHGTRLISGGRIQCSVLATNRGNAKISEDEP